MYTDWYVISGILLLIRCSYLPGTEGACTGHAIVVVIIIGKAGLLGLQLHSSHSPVSMLHGNETRAATQVIDGVHPQQFVWLSRCSYPAKRYCLSYIPECHGTIGWWCSTACSKSMHAGLELASAHYYTLCEPYPHKWCHEYLKLMGCLLYVWVGTRNRWLILHSLM